MNVNPPEGLNTVDPGAVVLDPPVPLFRVEDHGVVVTSLQELHTEMRVAVPNPWSDTESYLSGVVVGEPGSFMFEGTEGADALGQLELRESGWCCVAIARKSVIIDSIGREIAAKKPKSFTSRLLKRVGTRRR